jgi:uncharacterized membrane protein
LDLAGLHIVAACAALAVGAVVLVGRKGTRRHAVVGRFYLAAMLAVNIPVLFVYDTSGRPGAFHVLAVVSLVTTGLGWLSLRRRPRRTRAHAAFMTWSFVGVVTAGLAQLANRELPQQAPLPVVVVIVLTTVIGLVGVPRFIAGHLRRAPEVEAPTSARRAVSAGCR